jgi:hypothetical protein
MAIGKQSWPPGPWHQEPDQKIWTDDATGLPCAMRRNEVTGIWLGYVGVPRSHPLFGKGYDEASGLSVHGGLTYASEASNGEWWYFGFDCGHAFDAQPGLAALLNKPGIEGVPPETMQAIRSILDSPVATYRNMAYAENECRRLAAQLAAYRAA